MNKIRSGSNNFHLIKNKEEFSFLINKRHDIISNSKPTALSEGEDIKLFINGIIYNHNAQELIQGFLKHDVDFIAQLEGSFVIFMIKGEEFYIFTDKVNSKKAFYTFIDGSWYISTNFDALPKAKCKLSADGLACYLSNGVMYNGLSLFEEIKTAQRASSHSFKNSKVAINRYWNYQFQYSSNNTVNDELFQKELEQLLIKSIDLRYNSASDIAVSLSAGYDARGILGILNKEIKATGIFCFSYSLDTSSTENTDAVLSKQLAKQCGYKHETIKSYSGNLIDHLTNNAREGKCLSNFCDELDAWHSVAADYKFSDLFVGDECFGTRVAMPLRTKAEILDSLSITGSSGIGWLQNFISPKTYQDFCQRLDKINNEIFEKANAFSDPRDKKDFLYLDQRLSNVLMPWRENIASQVGVVHNPYLDGNILEFMMKLPPELRKGKVLFRKTITNMLPDLFTIPTAKVSGYEANWQEEIRKNKSSLISIIESTDSLLDDFISKKQLIEMINKQGSIIEINKRGFIIEKSKTFFMKAFNFIRKKSSFADRIFTIFLGPRVNSTGRPVPPDRLILRLLVMRIYLSQSY